MEYSFFVAWLRAKEKNLADSIDFDRMIGAINLEEGFKVLNDTDYASFLSQKDYYQIEEIIENEKNSFKKSLEQMGMEKKAMDFLFLKDELILLAGEIKKDQLKIEKDKHYLTEKYSDLVLKIKNKKISSLSQIDDMLIRFYFKKAIKFCLKEKEKELAGIFKKYWLKIKQAKNKELKERDSFLAEIEEKIIEKSKEKTEGIMPVLAFIIKKKRAENFIRTIFSAKRIGLDGPKINSLIGKTITL